MRHKTVVNWCHCLFDQPRTTFLNVQQSLGGPLPAKLSIYCRFSGTARNMSIKASALLSPPSRPAWAVSAALACFGTSRSLAVFTHRVLENRQNILQFISLPFIILNLFRDTISSCSCFKCGFRTFLNALLRFCQVFSLLLENLWSVFNLVFETVPFLSLSDFGHPYRGVLLSVL